MNLKQEIRHIEERLRKIGIDTDHYEPLVVVRVGIWRKDRDGNIIEGSGKTKLVPKSQVRGYGFALFEEPMTTDEWVEFSRSLHEKQNQTN